VGQQVEIQLACGGGACWACRQKPGGLVGQRPDGPTGEQWPPCSFSVLRYEEAFHWLSIKGAHVSDLPAALPQPSLSPASQKCP
jgi:hypothetical protein